MAPWQRLKEEPLRALYGGLIALEWALPEILDAMSAFGVEVTVEQQGAVSKLVTTAILLLSGEYVRSKVVPETKRLRKQREADRRPAGTGS